MSSSSGALTRSRSTRKPGGKTEKEEDAQRTVSPSRLPVKGTATAAAAAGRPRSITFGRVRQATVGAVQDAPSSSSSTTSSRPPRTMRAPTVTHPPSASRPNSSTSNVRPTTSSGLPPSSVSSRQRAPSGPAPPGHSRTKSSITSLTGATILRPPSQGSAPPTSSATSSASQTSTDRSRPPISSATRAAAHRRQLSGPALSSTANPLAGRRAARDQPAQGQPAHINPTMPTTTTAATHATGSTDSSGPPRARPAFSTLQQHYSPAKSLAPKPLTSTFFAPPSPSKLPANVVISAETARLQTELLQLHLMHRDADAITAQWRASARDKLGLRFSETAARTREAEKLEAAAEEMRNVKELVAWGDRSRRLEEKVQTLDSVLSGLWALGEPRGRYARVVRRFEKYMGRVHQVMRARQTADFRALALLDGEDVLVGELDAQMKSECAGFVRRLDEWRRSMRELDGPADGEGEQDSSPTSLTKILTSCRALIHDMLAELDVMEQMERAVVADEMRWVREMNRIGGDEEPRAGAIWRVL